MNNIYPSGGFNPFGPPDMNSGINLDEIRGLIGLITPYISEEKKKIDSIK